MHILSSQPAKSKVLHNFKYDGKDGIYPYASLISDAAGNLYGTTAGGGAYDYGTVFQLEPGPNGTWTEIVLHSFDFKHGAYPYASLIFDAAGNLYGTTIDGGDHTQCLDAGCGTVFELSPKAAGGWTEKVLHTFGCCKDGFRPYAGVIFDAAGNLYGSTVYGGAYGVGAVFELSPRTGGTWTEKVLHSFNNNNKDGFYPSAGVILDAAGNIYGATAAGGDSGKSCGGYGCGTVFELSPEAGGSWTEKNLHSFNSDGKDGYHSAASLMFDADGNLYGAALYGGAYNAGTVFELTPKAGASWKEEVLHNFGSAGDGAEPQASLIFDAAGNLYGAASYGGAYMAGTVFELTRKTGGSWKEKVLHSFNDNGRDGTVPSVGLIFDAAGNLYGTTGMAGDFGQGCDYGCGTVFEITP